MALNICVSYPFLPQLPNLESGKFPHDLLGNSLRFPNGWLYVSQYPQRSRANSETICAMLLLLAMRGASCHLPKPPLCKCHVHSKTCLPASACGRWAWGLILSKKTKSCCVSISESYSWWCRGATRGLPRYLRKYMKRRLRSRPSICFVSELLP